MSSGSGSGLFTNRPLRMELVVQGTDLTARDLTELSDRARNAKPAMQAILRLMVAEERVLFETEGGSGGDPWPADKPSTVERKRREHLDIRTERATGALARSLTEPNYGKGRVRRASKQQVTFGTKVHYARYQGKRPLLQFTQTNVDDWTTVLVRWLMDGEARL